MWQQATRRLSGLKRITSVRFNWAVVRPTNSQLRDVRNKEEVSWTKCIRKRKIHGRSRWKAKSEEKREKHIYSIYDLISSWKRNVSTRVCVCMCLRRNKVYVWGSIPDGHKSGGEEKSYKKKNKRKYCITATKMRMAKLNGEIKASKRGE